MSVASEELAGRIRALIGHRPGVTEKKMFGGFGFMLYGNMVCGAMKSGALLMRVGPGRYEEALSRPGAVPMHMGGKQMVGFVQVTDDIEDDDQLMGWIAYGWCFVETLPAKDAAPAKGGKAAARKSPARKSAAKRTST
jgi:TfoX/Sxy family transcriptional regulator of competence genes